MTDSKKEITGMEDGAFMVEGQSVQSRGVIYVIFSQIVSCVFFGTTVQQYLIKGGLSSAT